MTYHRLRWLFLLTLIPALLWAHLVLRPLYESERPVTDTDLKQMLPEAEAFQYQAQPWPHWVGTRHGEKLGVVFRTAQVAPEVRGYAGPIDLLVGMDQQGKLVNSEIFAQQETPSYFRPLLAPGFVQQFKGKTAGDAFQAGTDVNGITRATVSCHAVFEGLRMSARRIGRDLLQLPLPVDNPPAPGWKAVAQWPLATVLLLLLGWAAYSYSLPVRWSLLTLALIALGPVFTTWLALAGFMQILWGLWPPLRSELLWYVLMAVGLGGGLWLGRLYCGYLCPFGALCELSDRFVTGRWRVHMQRTEPSWRLDRAARLIKVYLAWAVVILVLLLYAKDFSAPEPFDFVLSLLQLREYWYLAAFFLAMSLLIPRFYCRYFCLAGGLLSLLPARSCRGKFSPQRKCVVCGKCITVCPMRARHLDPAAGQLEVLEYECIGCGACRAVCKQR